MPFVVAFELEDGRESIDFVPSYFGLGLLTFNGIHFSCSIAKVGLALQWECR